MSDYGEVSDVGGVHGYLLILAKNVLAEAQYSRIWADLQKSNK
jgi:hypothetical protein